MSDRGPTPLRPTPEERNKAFEYEFQPSVIYLVFFFINLGAGALVSIETVLFWMPLS